MRACDRSTGAGGRSLSVIRLSTASGRAAPAMAGLASGRGSFRADQISAVRAAHGSAGLGVEIENGARTAKLDCLRIVCLGSRFLVNSPVNYLDPNGFQEQPAAGG